MPRAGELSKIEAGRIVLEDKPFEPGALASQLLAIVGESARARGLHLRIDFQDLPSDLQGDTARLSQALVNYLSKLPASPHPIGLDCHTADMRSCVLSRDAVLDLGCLNAAIGALVVRYGDRL